MNTAKRKREIRRLFIKLRSSMAQAGLTTVSEDAVICPLCWRETPLGGLTLEHIVPEAVGGKQLTVTCRDCNNNDGSSIDANLSHLQKASDAAQGLGTIRANLPSAEGNIAADCSMSVDGGIEIKIVDKASNPAAVEALRQEAKTGRLKKIDFNLLFNYTRRGLQEGFIRCAYLATFNEYGYRYSSLESLQAIRRELRAPSPGPPSFRTLIVGSDEDLQLQGGSYFVTTAKVDGFEVMAVVLKIEMKCSTHRIVFLPSPNSEGKAFYSAMEEAAAKERGKATIVFDLFEKKHP